MKRNVLGLFLSLLSVLVRITAAASAQSSVTDRDLEGLGKWHILDKHNYSSQIRIHLNIILIVSVSWSGESRSLMREISDLVTVRAEEFGSLELMYLHRNKEKMLADAIGASGEGGVSVFYLHHSVPYKYQGRLRAISILYSISPYLSHEPEEIPLKELKSEHELRTFIDSTDKAVLLMEFCGWTHQLLARDNKNGTHSSGDFAGANGETERPPISLGQENQKGDEKAMLTCGTESAFSGIPSLGEFRSGNNSSTGQEDESWGAQKENSDAGLSCTYEQFQQFDSSFSKFMAVAREFFLPNEKHRFGLVSEQSLLSSLGIGHPGSWAVMLACNGCQIAARILRHDDDLKTILQSDNSVVTELEDNGEGVDPALLSNKPSVVLFVDRLSDSSEMRRKSREALHQFRDVAFHLQVPDSMRHQNDDRSERSINQKPQKFNVLSSGHPALKLSSSVQRHNLKEKRSIMVINDGKHTVLENVQLDFQGKSLQEILNYVVQKKKEVTLSSVAKEAGFQLLSQDLGIMPDDSLTTEGEIEATRESFKSSELSPITIADNLDKNLALNNEEQSSNVGSPRVEEKSAYLVTPDKPMKLDQLVSDVEVSVTGRMKLQPELYPSFDTSREQLEVGSFHGSFLFSDGNYRLLEALTGDTRIPSLVIIDPVSQQHYVLTANIDFSCSTIESFVNRFLNKTLVSFQQSESEPASSREGPYPPFGYQNFQEVDSIPRVTAHSFHEMVIGFNQSDNESMVGAWNEDVLVLFSNSWCGFCLRMDLVVREVFRAVKGCMNVLNMGSSIRDTVFSCSSEAKFPKIFLMECTLNDCSHILRSMGMRDVYPALLLFPAESKLAIPYQGDATVHKIIEFIVNRGSNSEHRTTENGILL
ncbi:hypothetical protein LINPERHAP1_LOCUS26477 [Linum perenne]